MFLAKLSRVSVKVKRQGLNRSLHVKKSKTKMTLMIIVCILDKVIIQNSPALCEEIPYRNLVSHGKKLTASETRIKMKAT
jgi:hypothetical protein